LFCFMLLGPIPWASPPALFFMMGFSFFFFNFFLG
jgi:hypothetical protein